MEENKQKNSRKRLNSLILLVAFTAVMLIVSTYAWFSSQKNVTLGGLKGKVNVAEGLQISLDAKTWKNEIDFGSFAIDKDTNIWTSDVYLPGATLNQPYLISEDKADASNNVYAKNILPTELLPVSTTADANEAIGLDTINMYAGENTDAIKLTGIKKMAEEEKSGFYAIDFFLQNSSAEGVDFDPLQLEEYSSLAVQVSGKETTGLQNTARVALALYANDGTDNSKVGSGASTDEINGTANIIKGTTGTTITDVAMWEPNSDAHVQYIVDNNKYIKPDAEDLAAEPPIFTLETDGVRYGFAKDSQFRTYALTTASTTAKELKDEAGTDLVGSIANIYDWSATGTATNGLTKQNVLQTTVDEQNNGFAGDKPKQLVSTKDGATAFQIPGGQYVRMRMYLWLEGQDVDTVNYASLGGGVVLDLGISKPGTKTGS